jgi:hypothetical protein
MWTDRSRLHHEPPHAAKTGSPWMLVAVVGAAVLFLTAALLAAALLAAP